MKLRNTILILLIAAILIAGALSSFIGIPVNNGEYNPLRSLTYGSDLGGENHIYIKTAADSDISGKEKEVVSILRKRLKVFGLNGSSIESTGEGSFLIRIPVNETYTEQEAAQIAEMLITVGDIEVKTYDDSETFLKRDHIQQVDIMENSLGRYSIYLLMTNEGMTILNDRTEKIANTETANEKYIHVFYDGEQIAELTVRQAIDNGILGFNTSYTQQQAEYFKKLINTGKLPVKLEIDSVEKVGAISSNGIGDYINVLLILSCLYAVYMIIVYRLAGILSVVSYAGLLGSYITLASLTGLRMSHLSFAGTFVALIFYMICSIVLMEKTKDEYRIRKHMSTSFRNGYQALLKIATTSGFMLILAFVVYIASDNAHLETAGFGLGLPLILAYIFAVVFNWIFMKLLTGLSDSNGLFFSYSENKGGAEK